MSRILVPLDGSPLAEEVLPMARLVARALDAVVQLVSVVPLDRAVMELAGIDPHPQSAASLSGAEAYLRDLTGRSVLQDLDVEVEVRMGDVTEQILEVVAAKRVDLVAMTTHGAGGVTHRARGRIATELVHRLSVPVLIAPPGRAIREASRVLVPLDGSADAQRALPLARRLADGLGAAVHLLIVCDAEPAFARSRSERAETLDRLRQAASMHLHTVTLPDEETAVVEGHLVDGILEYARERQCELIAMATHGRAGQSLTSLGSIAEGVLSSSDRPLLLVPTRSVPT